MVAPHQSVPNERQDLAASPEEQHQEWIEAIALYRDRTAFANLFQHYAPRLKSYLLRSGASPGAAEDFAQDTMLTVWRKADLFDRSKARAATWIFTIARNRRIDVLRQEGRHLPVPEFELSQPQPDQPDSLLQTAEDAVRVNAALASLTAEQAQLIRMSFLHDQAHGEIARTLGVPLGTVKSRIRAALGRLRQQLAGDET
jgi:RNA polymerase sigma-70 factor (ECF subfamily)